MDPDGHLVSAAPILAPQGVGPGRRASGLPIGRCRARRRRLAETCYPGPCVINPCAAASLGRVGVPPPRSRQFGCQLTRAPPLPAWVSGRPGARPLSQHKAALWGPTGAGWGPGGEWKIS